MNLLLAINEERRGGLCKKTFPPDALIKLIEPVRNEVGISGTWCGQEAGYCPWVVVEVVGKKETISSFYLRQ